MTTVRVYVDAKYGLFKLPTLEDSPDNQEAIKRIKAEIVATEAKEKRIEDAKAARRERLKLLGGIIND